MLDILYCSMTSELQAVWVVPFKLLLARCLRRSLVRLGKCRFETLLIFSCIRWVHVQAAAKTKWTDYFAAANELFLEWKALASLMNS